jgi:hypothetical protein
LALDPERSVSSVKLERICVPVGEHNACEMVAGAEGPELAGALADKLLELKVF